MFLSLGVQSVLPSGVPVQSIHIPSGGSEVPTTNSAAFFQVPCYELLGEDAPSNEGLAGSRAYHAISVDYQGDDGNGGK